MPIKSIEALTLSQKKVLIREDFNVPIKEGRILDGARLLRAMPTILYALEKGAGVILMSHLGRPKEGEPHDDFSLAPVAHFLEPLLNRPVRFVTDYSQLHKTEVKPGEVVLLENTRFNVGEKANDHQLAKRLAGLCDIFVMDAFACAHRAHASTHGVAHYAKQACAGLLLLEELEALDKGLATSTSPVTAIVGGSKVSTKLNVLNALVDKVDTLVLGGGIANTFLKAAGFPIGKSLYEEDFVPTAKQLLDSGKIPLPRDVVVAKTFSAEAGASIKAVDAVLTDDMILDIGPATAENISQTLLASKTILWNGPVGVFEIAAFAAGTQAIAHAVANSEAFSIAGGGDTIAAINKFKVAAEISYISTGGGAFLEYVEGKPLAALEPLQQTRATLH